MSELIKTILIPRSEWMIYPKKTLFWIESKSELHPFNTPTISSGYCPSYLDDSNGSIHNIWSDIIYVLEGWIEASENLKCEMCQRRFFNRGDGSRSSFYRVYIRHEDFELLACHSCQLDFENISCVHCKKRTKECYCYCIVEDYKFRRIEDNGQIKYKVFRCEYSNKLMLNNLFCSFACANEGTVILDQEARKWKNEVIRSLMELRRLKRLRLIMKKLRTSLKKNDRDAWLSLRKEFEQARTSRT